jgi:hypothetical protein
MFTVRRPLRALLGTALAATSLGSLGLASSASAQSGYVAIKPQVAPKLDVAQGALFPLVARDASGISFAESWRFVPASNGHVLILNRLFKNGTTEMAMDVQEKGSIRADKAVGTSPRDGTLSQQWKIQPVPGTGNVELVNRLNGDKLAFRGTGFDPPYVQSGNGLTQFTIHPLGVSFTP